MKMSFRWYGSNDEVTLNNIRQIPNVSSIVSAVYDVHPGEVWDVESIMKLKKQIEDESMEFEVVESVPVHEDIKLGKPTRDKYINNYKENILRLSRAGIKVICYNFMPVFDWTRTQLDRRLDDGSTTLVYYPHQLEKMNPLTGELSLPGWDASYTKESLKEVFNEYSSITEEDLWRNLEYFLKEIIPFAEECNIKMAIHPDDPCWPIFGLPRIITCEENLDRLLKIVDSPSNGLTFCTGSLGVSNDNDILNMVEKYSKANRIHFLHLRNIKITPDGGFEETAHMSKCGDIDMVKALSILHKNNFTGYIRPDHGRMIWGETGRSGYGLYDRAIGASYINGIWETLSSKEVL